MQKQAEEMRIQAEKLEKESSSNVNSANFKNKKQELSLGIVKVGAVLESVEVKLKEKLALAKVKVEDYNSEFNRVREELSMAKQAVTSIQNEVIRCQQKQKEVRRALNRVSGTFIPFFSQFRSLFYSFPRLLWENIPHTQRLPTKAMVQ